jgi:hypothetical protein
MLEGCLGKLEEAGSAGKTYKVRQDTTERWLSRGAKLWFWGPLQLEQAQSEYRCLNPTNISNVITITACSDGKSFVVVHC